jgi:hypothetical protein
VSSRPFCGVLGGNGTGMWGVRGVMRGDICRSTYMVTHAVEPIMQMPLCAKVCIVRLGTSRTKICHILDTQWVKESTLRGAVMHADALLTDILSSHEEFQSFTMAMSVWLSRARRERFLTWCCVARSCEVTTTAEATGGGSHSN